MDCAGHDKECADHNNESRVFAGGMLHAGAAVEGEDIIAAGSRGQERTQFLVMPFPMLPQNERKDCNREEKNCEGSEQCGMRFDRRDGHIKVTAIAESIRGQVKARCCRPIIRDWCRLNRRLVMHNGRSDLRTVRTGLLTISGNIFAVFAICAPANIPEFRRAMVRDTVDQNLRNRCGIANIPNRQTIPVAH
jgi:hypothetical protein